MYIMWAYLGWSNYFIKISEQIYGSQMQIYFI